MNTRYLAPTICLLIGCATGVVMKDNLVPVADAGNGQVFEHRCVELKWDDVLGTQNLEPKLGAAGWELATFVSAEKKAAFGTTTRIVACFKRQAP